MQFFFATATQFALGFLANLRVKKGGNVRKIVVFLCGIVSAFASAGVVYSSPITYIGAFPSSQSIIVASVDPSSGTNFFFSQNHSISQIFTDTGLQYANQIHLEFYVTENTLFENFINWNVFINEVNIGSWSWSNTNGVGQVVLNIDFPNIVAAGSFAIAMRVINTIPPGSGSIALGPNGVLELSGESEGAKPIPEPATVMLFAIGLVGFATARKLLL